MTADIIEISRLALHDQVAARLRTMLVEGQIAPGAKLNERELCERLRVSRTPLREAIKLLAAEGLVDLLPNRGAVAVKLTEADVLDTFEVLAMLEGMSGELAAKRITEEALAEVRALHYEMLACFARRDLSGYYRLNARIHTAINEAAGNPVLSATYRSINARVQSLRARLHPYIVPPPAGNAPGDPQDTPGTRLRSDSQDTPRTRPRSGSQDTPRTHPWSPSRDASAGLPQGALPQGALRDEPRARARSGPRDAAGPELWGAEPGVRGTEPSGPTGAGRRRRRRRSTTRRWAVVGGAALALVTAGTVLVSQADAPSTPLLPGVSGVPALAEDAGTRWRKLPGQNPLRAGEVRFYVQPDTEAARQARTWSAQGRTADAALMRAMSEVPQAMWLAGGSPGDVSRTVRETVTQAERQRTVPVFVTNNIPGRDCWSGGAPDTGTYRAWINAVAEGIGDRPAVVALEPSGLARMPGSPECPQGGEPAAAQRYGDLSYAVETLTGLAGTAVYLDGGLAGWPGFTQMADRLVNAGAVRADGFYVNVVGYRPTEQSLAYASKLSRCLYLRVASRTASCEDAALAGVPDDAPGLPHFVVDTSRNGTGEWQPPAGRFPVPDEWCNPPGRGAGARPTADTGSPLADALLWLNSPGFSNGRCTRGTSGPHDPAYGVVTPDAGQWWPDQALERAKNAVPPLKPADQ